MATPRPQAGKKQKGSPKLRRSGRPATKARYAAQRRRTFENKLRRVRKHNGEEAARVYRIEHRVV